MREGQGKHALFYDPDPCLHIPFSLREKITRVNTLDELMLRCDYVIGCSGRNPFKGKWPLDHKPGIRLISASGGDQEFGPIITGLKDKPDFRVAPDTWDITSEYGPSGPISIAYLGYPYNFMSRSSEAVPTAIVQLETGGLLAALVQARLHLDLYGTGHERSSGIQRMSPEAQRYVYETWLRTMRVRNIDIVERFNYDSTTLSAAHHDRWFIEHTEPRPGEHYKPARRLEEMMGQFVYAGDVIQVGE
jgi:hypothetical protein